MMCFHAVADQQHCLAAGSGLRVGLHVDESMQLVLVHVLLQSPACMRCCRSAQLLTMQLVLALVGCSGIMRMTLFVHVLLQE
jgi:hypothetical protein